MRTVLVQLPDGTLVDKPLAAVRPGELVLVGGPCEFALAVRLQRELEAEIEASGGLSAWRAGSRPPSPPSRDLPAAAAVTVTVANCGDKTLTFTLPR
jgi:hypothetical protein